MDAYTRTRTHTSSYTYIDVKHVNWKIRSDLRYLRIMYGLFAEKYEEEMSGDLYRWVIAGYASQIKFVFYSDTELKLGVRYNISSTGVVSSDDDAGSIPCPILPASTTFDVILTPTAKWGQLPVDQKNRFYSTLSSGWGPSHLALNETGSTWTADKCYSSNTLSARRDVYGA